MPNRPLGIPNVMSPHDGSVKVCRAINKLKQYVSEVSSGTPYLAYTSDDTDDIESDEVRAFSQNWIMPRDFLEAGMVVRVDLWGRYYGIAGGDGLALQITVGPLEYLNTASQTLSCLSGSRCFHLQASFLVKSIGVNGSMFVHGEFAVEVTDGTYTRHVMLADSNQPLAIDTTLQHMWRVRPYFSPAGSAFVHISLDQFIITILSPAPPQPSAQHVTAFLDRFIEASDTVITSHTPDIPSAPSLGWTHLSSIGVGTVIGGSQQVLMDMNGGTSDQVSYTFSSGYNNGVFTTSMYFDAAGNNDGSFMGMLFRVLDNDNYITVIMLRNAGGLSGCALYKKVGGTFTQLAIDSFATTYDTVYTIVVTLSGTALTFSCNGRDQIVFTLDDTLNTDGQTHGIVFGGVASNSYGHFAGQYLMEF